MRAGPRLLAGVLAALLLVLGAGGAEAAKPDEAAFRRLNASLVERHVLPRYRDFAQAGAALVDAADAFCDGRTAERLAVLKDAYVAASDGWQRVQHLRFGPSEAFMRNMRIAFWPDPRNMVARQVDALLEQRDPAALAPEAVARGSVAGQGLPALERLLYGEDAEAALLGEATAAGYRCGAIQAVARNLAGISADTVADWTGGASPYEAVLRRADGGAYQNAREATAELFKSMFLAVELVADHKLKRPLGASRQAARPKLAEAWRSGRALANLRLDLAAAEAMYLGEGGVGFSTLLRDVAGDAALDDLLRRAFAQTRASADAIPVPLDLAVADVGHRPAVEQLQTETAALKALLVQRLAPALDIPVGFNALDGD